MCGRAAGCSALARGARRAPSHPCLSPRRWYCGIPVHAEQLPAGVPPQPACNPLVSLEPAWTLALLPAWAIPPSAALLLLLLLCAGVAITGQAAVARLALAFQPREKAHV